MLANNTIISTQILIWFSLSLATGILPSIQSTHMMRISMKLRTCACIAEGTLERTLSSSKLLGSTTPVTLMTATLSCCSSLATTTTNRQSLEYSGGLRICRAFNYFWTHPRRQKSLILSPRQSDYFRSTASEISSGLYHHSKSFTVRGKSVSH